MTQGDPAAPIDFYSLHKEADLAKERLRSRDEEPVDGGGDGPNNGRMGDRISELEKAMVRIDGRMDLILEKVRDIGNLKVHFYAGLLAAVLAIWAIAWAIQGTTLAAFRAAADTATQPVQQPIIINVPANQSAPQGPVPAPPQK